MFATVFTNIMENTTEFLILNFVIDTINYK